MARLGNIVMGGVVGHGAALATRAVWGLVERDSAGRRVEEGPRGETEGQSRAEQDERWKMVRGRPMFARTWNLHHPTAPAVVLVPGLIVSSAYFLPTAERMARSFRVLAPDPPGYGLSAPPLRVLRPPEIAEALIEWMSAMGLGRSMVVANSFGCQVAADLAMRRPDLVDRLVLVSPTMDPSARTLPSALVRWLRESRTQSLRFKKLLVQEYRRAGIRRAITMIRNALRDRIEDRLPFIDVPTLVVRGTADPIVTDAWAAEVAALLPDARLKVLPGVPHAMNFEAPDELVRAIRPFLSAPIERAG